MTATAAVRTAAVTNPPHLRPRRKAGIRSEEDGKTTYRPMDNFGFLKVAAAVPHVRVGDCDFNTERIAAMAEEAAQRGVEIVAFPELAVTAYTCADLLLLPALLDAADEALARLVKVDVFFRITANTIVNVFRAEQRHSDKNYEITIGNDNQNGVNSFNPDCGLIWSAYRPSDDVCHYKYFIPGTSPAWPTW